MEQTLDSKQVIRTSKTHQLLRDLITKHDNWREEVRLNFDSLIVDLKPYYFTISHRLGGRVTRSMACSQTSKESYAGLSSGIWGMDFDTMFVAGANLLYLSTKNLDLEKNPLRPFPTEEVRSPTDVLDCMYPDPIRQIFDEWYLRHEIYRMRNEDDLILELHRIGEYYAARDATVEFRQRRQSLGFTDLDPGDDRRPFRNCTGMLTEESLLGKPQNSSRLPNLSGFAWKGDGAPKIQPNINKPTISKEVAKPWDHEMWPAWCEFSFG